MADDDDDRFYGDDMERRDRAMRRGGRRRGGGTAEEARRFGREDPYQFGRGDDPYQGEGRRDPGYIAAPGRAHGAYEAEYGHEGGGARRRGGGDRGFFERAGDEIATWFGDDEAERRRRADVPHDQNYRGKGPKSYVRSDARILEDAHDRLTEDSRIDASDVEVGVAQGEVTLNGVVPTRAMKRRAEDIVDDIAGVKHTQNNLRVRGSEGGA